MKKMIQIVRGLVIAAGVTMIAGTAGASDLNTIDLGTIIHNCSIGLILMIGGAIAWIGGAADGE